MDIVKGVEHHLIRVEFIRVVSFKVSITDLLFEHFENRHRHTGLYCLVPILKHTHVAIESLIIFTCQLIITFTTFLFYIRGPEIHGFILRGYFALLFGEIREI